MDISASQCSSGCESGWTRYLDQSSLAENQFHRVDTMDEYKGKGAKIDQEKEVDLSLVSDASSGPSHYHEDYYKDCIRDNGSPFYSSPVSEFAGKSKKKEKAKAPGRHRRHSNLDDTASSPALSFPKVDTRNEDQVDNLLNFSQDFSPTHFKGKYEYQNHFGFFNSHFAEEPTSEEPGGGFHGRNWK